MSHDIEHSMFDDDPMFIIDEKTRDIVYQGEKLPAIMQYDHLAEIMTFQLCRYIDGHDVMLCNDIRVHFINISTDGRIKISGCDKISNLHVPEDNENVVRFCWCIPSGATQLEGVLQFVIAFKCVDMENSVMKYRWNTERNEDLVVLPGINNVE